MKRSILFMLFAVLCACSATRYLKEGESFYAGAKIEAVVQGEVKGVKALRNKIKDDLAPKPNKVILGSRPGVWMYYAVGEPKKEKGFRSWMKKKLGAEPVLLTDADPQRMARTLQGNLFNDGFFDSKVTATVETKNRKSRVTYTVNLFPPFVVRDIRYPTTGDSVFNSAMKEIEQQTLLKPGQRYNLALLKSEQSRARTFLEDKGFYYFDERFLLFEADSTVGHRQVDIALTIVPGLPAQAQRSYKIREVDIIDDYSLTYDSVQQQRDTIRVDGFTYSNTAGNFRPGVLTHAITLKPGSTYSRTAHNNSISRLMGLGTFKFVNVKYRPAPFDSAALDALIYLTPLLKKSIRMEIQAVSKSNNFVGPGVGITFTNRNFLGGAERLQIKADVSYEAQISSQQTGALNALEAGLSAGLAVPRIITPFPLRYHTGKYIPQTNFKAGFNVQQRIGYFRLNSFHAGYGYSWRETASKSHELYPVEMNFVQVSNTSDEFNELLNSNPVLANSFKDQFIPGMRYSYTYSSQLAERLLPTEGGSSMRNDFYFRGNVNLAGNLINLVHRNVTEAGEEPLQLFGQPYSQFIISDVDFRYYVPINKHSKLATRLLLGAGFALGNSTQLPYIRQFASGGSNSIRGFPARSIGPGTYNVRTDPTIETQTLFIDQRGDLKLEATAEYRFDIVGYFKGGLFVDAGNIWLRRDDPQRPGGEFNTNTFLNEVAVASGFGLRIDFTFFVLRFDLGFPLRKPWLPSNERWVIDQINFGSSAWRKENLVFNIAIGYPF
jgi:outer membrane protein insertion porin family